MGLLSRARVKSPWIVHFDCNSCNGCDIEVLAALTPMYDAERFGVVNMGNPKHADILVVTGSVNHRNLRVLRNIYSQMPAPKAVVAVGACACSGGIFQGSYNILGGIDKAIPVDVYVPGCSIKPEALLDGIIKATAVLNDKKAQERHREFLNTIMKNGGALPSETDNNEDQEEKLHD
ncbi:NADH ubiquinone oxidoreductase 20 kDa subunit [[Clostridium] cellulosi]|uniref:NADH ubiquinone oxidoreductase 20 kDa subunit n=1 Tax=[Clostridium] cellulosi TaxID=29343 RepID=A0A078KSG1_9FIRM|nr:NADH ubiquinone oxidoreductase 20 kDa subunit [[Clostridium] cellulosi]